MPKKTTPVQTPSPLTHVEDIDYDSLWKSMIMFWDGSELQVQFFSYFKAR